MAVWDVESSAFKSITASSTSCAAIRTTLHTANISTTIWAAAAADSCTSFRPILPSNTKCGSDRRDGTPAAQYWADEKEAWSFKNGAYKPAAVRWDLHRMAHETWWEQHAVLPRWEPRCMVYYHAQPHLTTKPKLRACISSPSSTRFPPFSQPGSVSESGGLVMCCNVGIASLTQSALA